MTQTNNRNMKFNRAKALREIGVSYLGKVGSSAKIIKSSKVLNIDTYVLYLAPFKMSGYNTCAGATKECIAGCLNTAGRAGMEIASDSDSRIIASRIKKTIAFFEKRDLFMQTLVDEIAANKILSNKKGNEFSVRLNGTSDLNWLAYKLDGKTIFEIFPDVQFYDYTKIANRFNRVLPKNYHLTLSYTGYNWNDCKNVLDKGHNVAIVFNSETWYNQKDENVLPLPIMFNGYKVINGDKTDYRPLDGKSVIVGLRWKRIANKDAEKTVRESKFVVNHDSRECTYEKGIMNEMFAL